MKKILCLLLCLSMITGCSKNKTVSSFMVLTGTDQYTLYDQSGEKLNNSVFKTYIENYNRGYLVTNEEDQKGYINYEGDFVVSFGEYDDIAVADEMIIATVLPAEETTDKETGGKKTSKAENKKNAKTKKVVEAVTKNTAAITNQAFILDNEGEIIYTLVENEILKISGLPILKQGDIWKVLYKNGEELYLAEDEIYYASHDKEYTAYLVGLKERVVVNYIENEELKNIGIQAKGNYVISDTDSVGCLLYDKTQKSVIFVDYAEQKGYTYSNINADNLYFDDSHNAIIEVGSETYLISTKLKEPLIMNSYYKDVNNYVLRGNAIYGPHVLYVNGVLTASLKDCQVFPAAVKLEGNYYPVYFKDKGYQYYDLQGKQPFTATYFDGEAFDKNNRAIVKDQPNSAFLINENGVTVTTSKYFDIKYIGSSYYAVYLEDAEFGIIDKDGKEILPIGYTALPEKCLFYYNGSEYLMVEKYGRTYVFDCSKEYKEVFSVEGNTVFNEKGYFLVDEDTYYTFEGEIIH